MLTFNQEVVERSELKSNHEVELCMRVKDGVRENAIKDILTVLNSLVLNNFESHDKKLVKDTLFVMAQLIDWNDLQYFEQLVQTCIYFL